MNKFLLVLILSLFNCFAYSQKVSNLDQILKLIPADQRDEFRGKIRYRTYRIYSAAQDRLNASSCFNCETVKIRQEFDVDIQGKTVGITIESRGELNLQEDLYEMNIVNEKLIIDNAVIDLSIFSIPKNSSMAIKRNIDLPVHLDRERAVQKAMWEVGSGLIVQAFSNYQKNSQNQKDLRGQSDAIREYNRKLIERDMSLYDRKIELLKLQNEYQKMLMFMPPSMPVDIFSKFEYAEKVSLYSLKNKRVEVDFDEPTRNKAVSRFKKSSEVQKVETIQLLDSQGVIDSYPEIKEYINTNGIVSFTKSNELESSPFDNTLIKINSRIEREVFIKVASFYQAAWSGSGQGEYFSNRQLAIYLSGVSVLNQANEIYSNNKLNFSKAINKASNILDFINGFSSGVTQEVKDSVQSLVDLKEYAQVLKQYFVDNSSNPTKIINDSMVLILSVPEALSGVVSELINDWDLLVYGDLEIQGTIVGEYSTKVLTALMGGGAAAKIASGSSKVLKIARRLTGDFRHISGIAGKSSMIAHEVLDSARKLGVKTKEGVSNLASLSKQVLRADTNTFKHLDKIAESASKVTPRLGNKYVKGLPDLTGSFKEAFEGAIHKGAYKPGEVFFQAMRTGQSNPGRWFTPIKPINASHADELLNIKKWGNDAGQLRVFKVKESVSGYAGKVGGGSGHQFFIPNDVPLWDVIEEIILD